MSSSTKDPDSTFIHRREITQGFYLIRKPYLEEVLRRLFFMEKLAKNRIMGGWGEFLGHRYTFNVKMINELITNA
ncbi:hypothetical protein BJP44_04275 [Candidatus Williamhamiltonella defendens]|uniref:Uncharacterized protein n=1 Tax=Candidatus Williamhamiltonella defendens TaxID=138072 RepID=A0A2D3TFE3_9ENTR|nr:hypothetical protein BJP44_04275 [Candidatus Hamiltonella defensa]ATW32288.1 hypothetical protein BJP42_08355 [Candidatus Hamiltonella defensa]ATW34404.1 hypothetical protein BJP43_09220 [Candidatus Hamiltonella defensa]